MKKLLTISSIVLGGFLFAQEKDYLVEKTESGISIMPYSVESVPLKVIQKNFVYKKYTVELLKKLIKIAEKDATFFESIPGEIIGWTSTDKGNQTQTETFKIKNGTLTKINTTVSESDLKKIDKFAPKNSHFELNNGLYDDTKYPSVGKVLKKLKDGTYLLSSRITLEFSNQEPHKIYDLEFQTKNFKNFVLKRIKDSESDTWTIVK
jgi:hypothetical protein